MLIVQKRLKLEDAEHYFLDFITIKMMGNVNNFITVGVVEIQTILRHWTNATVNVNPYQKTLKPSTLKMIKAFASYLRRLAIVERLFQGGITMKHQRNVNNSFGVVVTEMPTILQQKQNVKSDAKRKSPKTKLMMSLMENR